MNPTATGSAHSVSTATLTRGSASTTFLINPYRPNDTASTSAIYGTSPTSAVSITTATTASVNATSCHLLSRSRKITTPSATLTSGLMK